MRKFSHFILTLLIVSGCSKSDDTDVVQQSDWKLLEIPTGNDLNDIYFPSDTFGIACGSFGTFLKTDDAGQTWQNLDVGIGYTFLSVFALDENEFYTSRIGLYKTINSGVSFNEIGELGGIGPSISDIYFFDSQNGIIAKGSTVYSTSDSGNNWLPVYPHKGDARILEVTDNNTVYLAGGATFDSVTSGELHKSIDKGETWEFLELPQEIAGSQITAIDFLDSQTGYVSTFEDKLFKTADGGQNWGKIAELSFGSVTDLVYINENRGYLISQNKVYASIDGGAEWAEVYQTEPTISLTSIATTPKGNVFISGLGGTILMKK